MPQYYYLQDFRLGMDRRRASRVAAEQGSCWTLINAHITRGGDIERRKKFVAAYSLPTGTKGFLVVGDVLYVFGGGAEPGGIPVGITYQRLQHPDNPARVITEILDAEPFDGLPYAIAKFDDGEIYHYYDGAIVNDWVILAATIGSNTAVASVLADAIDTDINVTASSASEVVTITSATAGTAFTISAATQNYGENDDQSIALLETQANVVEVLASGDIQITGGTSDPGVDQVTSITVNGVEILGSAVDWVTSNAATAAAVAAQIDTYSSSPEYSVSVATDTITVSALTGTGATPNGYAIVVSVGGTVTVSADASLGGGVTAVAQIYTATIGGTFEAGDLFDILINGERYRVTGRASGTGMTVLAFRQKMYSLAGSNLYFCGLNNPNRWIEAAGVTDPGFINMAAQSEGQEDLTAAAEYQGLMAVFSRNNTRVWSIVEDSALNISLQTLNNVGTRSPRSVQPYGAIDVFFLAESGIRSLKSRDSSNAAYVSDVGTPIDTFVRAHLTSLTTAQVERAVAVIEPVDGRYWLAVGDRIYVFSFFPSAKISAWSYYDTTDDIGADITEMQRHGADILARAGDTIYVYGGSGGNTYPDADEIEVEVGLPYIHANDPATQKLLRGFDALCSNTWTIYQLPRLDDDTVEIELGTVDETTFGEPRLQAAGRSTAYGLKLTCVAAGAAVLSALALHYRSGVSG